ncbi:hypothetical protein TheveDRAFT_1543 [Thermanaerovibrio velox DSM 12556]|uniref:Uncharacterized protein n=1 Tax=Thermanaerovibrio velox DSM 12556 TaxID=926567 RepID=H0UPV2_9BACT|nr:hypothetical protein [Thermanaerovibrio velox]EHM10661.1 hypothetical protein TheveDRAFT_1543 [Thermanaerovibrio velox DSM 12556]
MKKHWILALAALLVLSLAASAMAGTASGSGTQIRGNPGRNAELRATPFDVPRGVVATITNASCDGDGFWIERDGNVIGTFKSAGDAIGFTLSGGTYRVYPNLKEGQFKQETARVQVTVTWP